MLPFRHFIYLLECICQPIPNLWLRPIKWGTDHGFQSLPLSIGWLPLGEGAYLHVGDPEALVIEVVGVPEVG